MELNHSALNMRQRWIKKFVVREIIFVCALCLLTLQSGVFSTSPAVAAIGEEIQAVQDEIAARKVKIDQINIKIDEYQEKIEQAEAKQVSLVNEVEILDNRVAKTELEIESAGEEISALNAEINITNLSIAEEEETLKRNRALISSVLREIRNADHVSTIDWVFGSDSFSELFDQAEKLQTIHSDLEENLSEARRTRNSLELLKQGQEKRMASFEEARKEMEKQVELLENEKGARSVLIIQTARSEAEFEKLLRELQAEEQYVSGQILALQRDIELKLKEGDIVGDSSALSWPIYPEKGISATFHDPTYPYRHLFEHSGIDIPVSVGTPIESAAPGFVAWTREGRLYGYYVLVIHANGVATLYAHLSRILVETDQFVSRGETVGLSGGRPGAAGAGLSTGPHLHFEVRKNGIPTNPMNYLVSH